MSDLVIIGNFATAKPVGRQGRKLINLILRRENVRRTPSPWATAPDYQKAIDALKVRIA